MIRGKMTPGIRSYHWLLPLLLVSCQFDSGSCTICAGLTYFAATTSEGTFTTPDYPSAYGVNVYCSWLIEAVDPTHLIQLTVDTNSMEQPDDTVACVYDYGRAFDGTDLSAPVLGEWCGTGTVKLTTTNTTMLVVFRSDTDIVSSGFSATYVAGLTFPEESTTSYVLIIAVSVSVFFFLCCVVAFFCIRSKLKRSKRAKDASDRKNLPQQAEDQVDADVDVEKYQGGGGKALFAQRIVPSSHGQRRQPIEAAVEPENTAVSRVVAASAAAAAALKAKELKEKEKRDKKLAQEKKKAEEKAAKEEQRRKQAEEKQKQAEEKKKQAEERRKEAEEKRKEAEEKKKAAEEERKKATEERRKAAEEKKAAEEEKRKAESEKLTAKRVLKKKVGFEETTVEIGGSEVEVPPADVAPVAAVVATSEKQNSDSSSPNDSQKPAVAPVKDGKSSDAASNEKQKSSESKTESTAIAASANPKSDQNAPKTDPASDKTIAGANPKSDKNAPKTGPASDKTIAGANPKSDKNAPKTGPASDKTIAGANSKSDKTTPKTGPASDKTGVSKDGPKTDEATAEQTTTEEKAKTKAASSNSGDVTQASKGKDAVDDSAQNNQGAPDPEYSDEDDQRTTWRGDDKARRPGSKIVLLPTKVLMVDTVESKKRKKVEGQWEKLSAVRQDQVSAPGGDVTPRGKTAVTSAQLKYQADKSEVKDKEVKGKGSADKGEGNRAQTPQSLESLDKDEGINMDYEGCDSGKSSPTSRPTTTTTVPRDNTVVTPSLVTSIITDVPGHQPIPIESPFTGLGEDGTPGSPAFGGPAEGSVQDIEQRLSHALKWPKESTYKSPKFSGQDIQSMLGLHRSSTAMLDRSDVHNPGVAPRPVKGAFLDTEDPTATFKKNAQITLDRRGRPIKAGRGRRLVSR